MIIIPGNPVGKGRPRFSKNGHARTPQKTRDWETRAAWAARQTWKGPPLAGGVRVEVDVVHPRPQRLNRRKDPEGRIRCDRSKLDLDNVIKAVLDALQGICYLNDNQVCELVARKFFTAKHEVPRVEVVVSLAD